MPINVPYTIFIIQQDLIKVHFNNVFFSILLNQYGDFYNRDSYIKFNKLHDSIKNNVMDDVNTFRNNYFNDLSENQFYKLKK